MSRRPRKVELYRDAAGEWRWRAVAKNGKTVADSSEGYVELRDCLGEAWALFEERVDYQTENGFGLNPSSGVWYEPRDWQKPQP